MGVERQEGEGIMGFGCVKTHCNWPGSFLNMRKPYQSGAQEGRGQ